MGTTPEQARQAVAATRGRLDATLDRLEARLRYQLDPRQRLKRDGAKLAAGVVVVAAVGVVYLVRARRRHQAQQPTAVDWISAMPDEWHQRLQELLAEAVSLGQLPVARPSSAGGGKSSLAGKLAMRAARMAAPMVMSAAAERIGRRQAGPDQNRPGR